MKIQFVLHSLKFAAFFVIAYIARTPCLKFLDVTEYTFSTDKENYLNGRLVCFALIYQRA